MKAQAAIAGALGVAAGWLLHPNAAVVSKAPRIERPAVVRAPVEDRGARLRMERLKAVQDVSWTAPARDPFQFGVRTATVSVNVRQPASVGNAAGMTAGIASRRIAPPEPLTFYGYSRARGGVTAYLLDGEEIVLASEGDTVKRRYRIMRIGTDAVAIEDLNERRQFSARLAEEL